MTPDAIYKRLKEICPHMVMDWRKKGTINEATFCMHNGEYVSVWKTNGGGHGGFKPNNLEGLQLAEHYALKQVLEHCP